jgi:hypothetical protein
MGISKKIVSVVMAQMPPNAIYDVVESEFSGAVLRVRWKLNNDPKRPNKASKTIVIFLTRELLEDFPDYPESMQETALQRIASSIRARLQTFEPDHTATRYQEPPAVHWEITTEEIFG